MNQLSGNCDKHAGGHCWHQAGQCSINYGLQKAFTPEVCCHCKSTRMCTFSLVAADCTLPTADGESK